MKRSKLAIALLGAATVLALSLPSVWSATPGANAQDDPEAVVTALGDAYNAGDEAAFIGLFIEDGVFMDIGGPISFGVFGRPALASYFEGFGDDANQSQTSVGDAVVDGNTVTGSFELRHSFIMESGFERIIQNYTAVVEGKQIASFVITYDTSDAETADYVQYVTDNPGEGEEADDNFLAVMEGEQEGYGSMFLVNGRAWAQFNLQTWPEDGMLQPATLYEGTCDALGGVFIHLAPVLNGISLSILSDEFEQFVEGFAMVVRASEEDDTIVSCGELAVVEEEEPVEEPEEEEPTDEPAETPTIQLPNTGGGSTGPGSAWLIVALVAAGAAGLAGFGGLRMSRR